ncbi:bifunctional adenosylcobinamide kinase/adenosylcobinamide-phosphate guanylyltransferase [Leptospira yasudae]|uniref:bifunctional adenosylcobinamide kinase/adenosylcobinamide-phosphate guanylyltransferase n=1 Tax=Leptospira yasudae TaxID=2202201 RepID=UPI001083A023|nr:bifunctional adenosylcobinamide kinase/adenosylcobinamide-phosphate guanylyltransferase [Leptospira yasudae]TGK27740.1 bifunctional adenosylcobinamide kinase/adenosylcobinamide-phosphate guanylyltransferase [Leptospira yasudae]TGM06864.1 bifunctional adenosylcobinamide kinase/adenosylcobinamide-phosphate guanylyltransferase [Leptospira yasudae]
MAGITLITGGCRSGKSGFALRLAEESQGEKVFVATCPILDQEMHQRIHKHKQERENARWITVEEETNLASRFDSDRIRPGSIVVVDCLSLWINNLLYQAERSDRLLNEEEVRILCKELTHTISRSPIERVIFVSSEVGLGIVPPTKSGRIYRDLLGTCNQTVAQSADSVYFMVSGIPLSVRNPKRRQLG